MQRFALRREFGDERLDATLVLELARDPGRFVLEDDAQAAVQVGELAQAVRQLREVVVDLAEDLVIREERRDRAGVIGLPDDGEFGRLEPARELLMVDLSVAVDLDDHVLGQRVHNRHADAVQASRDVVALVVELAAGVERRHHQLERRDPGLGVNADRHAAPVVGDGDAVVGVNGHLDLGAESGQSLVDRVVDDLLDQVHQPGLPVLPMYMPGRSRTGSSPSRTLDLIRLIGLRLLALLRHVTTRTNSTETPTGFQQTPCRRLREARGGA